MPELFEKGWIQIELRKRNRSLEITLYLGLVRCGSLSIRLDIYLGPMLSVHNMWASQTVYMSRHAVSPAPFWEMESRMDRAKQATPVYAATSPACRAPQESSNRLQGMAPASCVIRASIGRLVGHKQRAQDAMLGNMLPIRD